MKEKLRPRDERTKINMQIIWDPERKSEDYGEKEITENIMLRIFQN